MLCGRFQIYYQRSFIDGQDAKFRQRQLASDDGLVITDRFKQKRISRRCPRRKDPVKGRNKLLRGYRIAVRPDRILAKVKRILTAIRADIPTFRDSRE